MQIGVLSDSHFRTGRPMPQVAAIFRDAALILHAGDVGDSELLDWLKRIAPVDWVAGNCDRGFEAVAWPCRRVLQVEGVTIGMIHGDGYGGTTPGTGPPRLFEPACAGGGFWPFPPALKPGGQRRRPTV